MSLYEGAIMSLFDLTAYLIVSSKLLLGRAALNKKGKYINIIAMMIFLALIMGVLGVTSVGKYSFFYGALISNLFIYLLYKKNWRQTVYTYIISTIIILLIQILVIALFAVFKVDKAMDFQGGLMAQAFIIPILILVHKFVPIDLLVDFINKKNRVFIGLIVNMFIVFASFLVYRYIEMEGLLRDIFLIAFLSIGLLFVNLVILKNGLRNEYEDKMLATYKKYLPVIDSLIKELRSKQHDFDNHIQALNMITLTSRDYESIVNSMKKYIDDLDVSSELNKLIKLDNKILAGFLYEKTIKAEENNIDFQIEIKDHDFRTNLKDYELVEVIGNLIDNAFETGVENNRVFLSIKREKKMSAIEIRNLHPFIDSNSFSKFFSHGYSTKINTGHGIGLANVKKIINKNNGLLSVQNESFDGSNYIVFKVLLTQV